MNLFVSALATFDPKPVVFGSEIPFDLFKMIVGERVFNFKTTSDNSFSSSNRKK